MPRSNSPLQAQLAWFTSTSLASSSFHEPISSCSTSSMAEGLAKFDRHLLSMSPNIQRRLYRSCSNQFSGSTLYAPLLDGPMTSPVLAKDIPVLRLDEIREDGTSKLDSVSEARYGGQWPIGYCFSTWAWWSVFSWRHVMASLARQSNCTVAAFDRPGWGLTSRLRRQDREERDLPNPYKLESQVDLLLSFCSEIGFSSVVLIGHDDGGLLALKAAQRFQSSVNSFNASVSSRFLFKVDTLVNWINHILQPSF